MPPSSTPSERSLQARAASYASWAQTADPRARTEPARRASLNRFDLQVDPDGTLPPAERARRAAALRKSYFTKLALRSAQARRRRAAERQDARAEERRPRPPQAEGGAA